MNHASKRDTRHRPRSTPTTPPDKMPELVTGNETDLAGYRNCVGCGFVYRLEDFQARDSCGFCSRPMSSKNRKENRRRQEEGEDLEGLRKVEALRDRLYELDQRSILLTRREGLVQDNDVA